MQEDFFFISRWHFFKKRIRQSEVEQILGLDLPSRHWSLCFIHLCDAVWVHFGQTGAEIQAGFDPFLSLASVAEPDSDHLLLQVEAFGYPSYFLGGWLTLFHKAALQSLLSAQAAGREQGRKNVNQVTLNIVWHILYFSSLIPDGGSPLPLPLIHSYFIIVQGCRKDKKYVVSLASLWLSADKMLSHVIFQATGSQIKVWDPSRGHKLNLRSQSG